MCILSESIDEIRYESPVSHRVGEGSRGQETLPSVGTTQGQTRGPAGKEIHVQLIKNFIPAGA